MATVLIVEDEDQLRHSLTLSLACRGLTVAEADNVETAIEALKAYAAPFDVILLDINLPDGTGWDVLRYLRDWTSGPATAVKARRLPAVIVMTAVRPAQCCLDEFRPAALLVKPFPMDVLARLLDHALTCRSDAEALDSLESAGVRAAGKSFFEAQSPLDCQADMPCDYAELDIEDAFGDNAIEYWMRHGNKLVPATDDEVAQIHEWERDSAALARLPLWEHQQTGTGSGFARLLHGLAAVRQRLRHSHVLLRSGDDQRPRRLRSPRATVGIETNPRDM